MAPARPTYVMRRPSRRNEVGWPITRERGETARRFPAALPIQQDGSTRSTPFRRSQTMPVKSRHVLYVVGNFDESSHVGVFAEAARLLERRSAEEWWSSSTSVPEFCLHVESSQHSTHTLPMLFVLEDRGGVKRSASRTSSRNSA